MSRTLAANCRSRLSLKTRNRYGARPWVRQIFCTVLIVSPIASAIARLVQCVVSPGDAPSVRAINLPTTGSGSGALPGCRATSHQPRPRHPRWTFHFTPTSASWLNAVEGFFAKLTQQRLQRGVFHSLVALRAAINRYLGDHNCKPKPFVWTADPDRIIAAANRRYEVLDSIPSHVHLSK
jgi:hypothetical protein